MKIQHQIRTTPFLAAAALLLSVIAAGCNDSERVLGTGGELTSTPCTQCGPADRPACGSGETTACFVRSNGTCGWARCAQPQTPVADAGPAPDPAKPDGGPAPDPARPDAGKTCGPVCAIYCQYGNKTDSAGCPTCECNPPPNCPQVDCQNKCPNGNKKDARGCETCECVDAAPSCATVLCPPNSRCELKEVMCVTTPCHPQPTCVPIKTEPEMNPCAAPLCPAGTVCVPKQVTCVRAPCPPMAECVPQVRCGGIAGFKCPGQGVCQDDPTDSCDPARGGADCGGVCSCGKPNGECPPDRIWDGSPGVCACVPVTGGVACGKSICPSSQVCCNASCGVCTPPGGACDLRACAP